MNLRTQIDGDAPHLSALRPRAALPGATVEVRGEHLGARSESAAQPTALLDELPTYLTLSREKRAVVAVPDSGVVVADVCIVRDGLRSNGLALHVATPLVEDIHPVGSPAVDAQGNVYVMNSGPRGEAVEVSVFRVEQDYQVRPFLRDLMNISALAFGPDGHLYACSRAEGIVYRASASGAVRVYAEGMGVATGLAFDAEGNLYVGDRSGTIFKIARNMEDESASGEIFVFATLEPSVAAYHIAFLDDGTLLVAAPTTATHGVIHAIAPNGDGSIFYRGLGRPQGLAVAADGSVYVAASLRGHRGIVRIADGVAEVAVAGDDLVGVCFLEDGIAALTTRSALFHLDLGVEGRRLNPAAR